MSIYPYILIFVSLLSISRAGQLISDKSCSYSVELDSTVSVYCKVSSFNNNFNEILDEIKMLDGSSYDINIESHYFPVIVNSSFKDIQVDYLDMSMNRIESISDELFEQMASCVYISLRYNLLKDPFVINAPDLETLDLENNVFGQISRVMFKNLRQLQTIILTSNRVSHIEPDAFADLKNLRTIYLDGNLLASLSPGLFANSKYFVFLDLHSNYIKSISELSLTGMNRLTALDLSHNQISRLEDRVFENLTKLQDLKLRSLRLESIKSAHFAGIEKLETLGLNDNFISQIESDVFLKLASLTTMDLKNNMFGNGVCSFINSQHYYAEINLRSNQLTEIPAECFINLKQGVKEIRLTSNSIYTVSENGFKGLEKTLIFMDLASNNLQTIKKHYFSNLMALEALFLSYNQISAIEMGSFDNLLKLNRIILDNNCIYQLDWYLFHDLVSLQTLNLSFNLLSEIERPRSPLNLSALVRIHLRNNILYDLSGLEYINSKMIGLYLSNNYFPYIAINQTDVYKYLKELDVSDNQFLKWINFSNMPSLEQLDVSNTSLTISYVGTFNKIKILNISGGLVDTAIKICGSLGNKMSQLYLNSIEGLNVSYLFKEVMNPAAKDNIETLHLTGFTFYESFDSFGSMKNLLSLDLSNNKGLSKSKLNNFFLSQPSLAGVSLINIEMNSLDNLNFSSLPELRLLYLNKNKLSLIKKAHFMHNTELMEISLRDNLLVYIEYGALSLLTKLYYIDVANNQIRSLEPVLNVMEVLELSRNNLSEIFDYMLIYCYKLDISNNQLKEVMILKSQSINDLNLSGNKITILRNDSFLSLIELERLDISRNQVVYIQANAFKKLFVLESLDLSQNELREMTDMTLAGLNGLIKLNLSHNRLEYLSQEMIADLYNLEKLDISGNMLKHIRDMTFVDASVLKQLKLSNNPYFRQITNETFYGLANSVNLLYIDRYLTEDLDKLIILMQSFKSKPFYKKMRDSHFFYSMDLLYDSGLSLSLWDCFSTLFLIRFNLKLNLYTDKLVEFYIDQCQDYFNQVARRWF